MSRPERDGAVAAALDGFVTMPGLPRDTVEPVFAEPWHAQAFALAVELVAAGAFAWSEWTAALAAELAAAGGHEADDGSHYYEAWLRALEHLLARKGIADPAAIAARQSAWEQAYHSTPHGQPVALAIWDEAGRDGR